MIDIQLVLGNNMNKSVKLDLLYKQKAALIRETVHKLVEIEKAIRTLEQNGK